MKYCNKISLLQKTGLGTQVQYLINCPRNHVVTIILLLFVLKKIMCNALFYCYNIFFVVKKKIRNDLLFLVIFTITVQLRYNISYQFVICLLFWENKCVFHASCIFPNYFRNLSTRIWKIQTQQHCWLFWIKMVKKHLQCQESICEYISMFQYFWP